MKAIGLALILSVLVGCSPERTSGFSHKAVTDVSSASTIVGGFSDEDRWLYIHGLGALHRAHRNPGQYTIAQVIDEERARDQNRSDPTRPLPPLDVKTLIIVGIVSLALVSALVIVQRTRASSRKKQATAEEAQLQAHLAAIALCVNMSGVRILPDNPLRATKVAVHESAPRSPFSTSETSFHPLAA